MKSFGIFILGGILGIVGGAGGMLIAFPYLFPPAPVNESVSTMSAMSAAVKLVGESRFREGVPGQDAVHWGRGGVKWYRADGDKILLELQSDFKVGAGPDYWIYLNTKPNIDDENGFLADAERIRVAKIKSFSGSQVYAIDASQFERARAITVWCETFGEYIASANL